ncbi:hypothetical protein A2483_01935 [Candidatus Peregrinibacteria bacterium RIFOXYC2_FULL_33_13]|nr:MAG: hypothetical protein UR27_C0004G0009 [Candidatus Peregrinibacteria bacterium GW2011_GWA2_33_10]KKP41190.1 MAG: hypothetical protein UR30_C0001G0037 [Candidatus Peregrinibacteria bacterium GW2011_GWC2_33_13]OGJ49708.1 MAG: hypothetical protein A2229_01055 [Candidatus Peregrinibacteria bacterium RIFOXYA2_FULL_33_7]OGJ52920.1 MAG: hypothetical protein A2483_01935 [Candidatus Peregrinibacteria bacterium RIFOXYC2_FULL_33_13]
MHFFKKISESKSFDLHKGVKVKVLTTSNDESMTAIQLEIEPGSLMPTHKHFEEQFGFIKEGKLRMWIGDEEETLETGDFYYVPPDKEHGSSTVGDKKCVKIDVFYPRRKDYLEMIEKREQL